MENILNEIDELVSYIIESREYQNCIKLKEKIDEDIELKKLIEQVKTYQKKYIKSNYSNDIKKDLDNCMEELNNKPLYIIYSLNLEKVNEKLSYIKDELNDYFYKLFNNKNTSHF